MIKSFGILYAGHIDSQHIGFQATPANERRFDNAAVARALTDAADIAKLADRLGYDILWMAEHHFQREGFECIPNILMLSVHLASLTKRVKFGCAFNIIPIWHPLRLAEDYAVADILTGGRVIFGVGRGYHTREVETLGGPLLDQEANRSIFEESIELILKAWNNDSFTHQGRHYQLPPQVPYRGYTLQDLTLVPRPVHHPIQVWQPIVSGSARGIQFMHQHGIKGMVSGVDDDTIDKTFRSFRDVGAQMGKDLELGQDLCLGLRFYLAESQEEGIQKARIFHEEGMKFSGPLGFSPNLTEDQRKAIINPKLYGSDFFPSLEEEVAEGVWTCGPAKDAIAKLKDIESKYPGLEHVLINIGVSTHKKVYMEQLEHFAAEVMPAFIKTPSHRR
ncbi:MAG: LLM class flavin-dependent oxidoreductase [SAR202 cluster bacterium]|nr:LLM class flavin-dependent oxidoreductase [SAR202 cluster bacterium]